jgi:hypothetical protein
MRVSPDWIRRGWVAAAVAGLVLSSGLALKNHQLATTLRAQAAPPLPAPAADPEADPAPTPAQEPAAPPADSALSVPVESRQLSLMTLVLHGDLATRLKQLRDMGIRIHFDDFLAMGQGLPSPWREQALGILMQEWSPDERMRALTWAGSLPAGGSRDNVLQALASAARADSESIIQWLLQLPEGQGRSMALMTAIRQTAQGNPARAAQWIDTLGKSQPILQSMSPEILSQWMRTDIPAATAWAGRIPAGPIRDQAYFQVANTLAVSSPDLAMSWAKAIETEGIRQAAVSHVISQLANQDLAAAARYLSDLPAGPGYDMAAMRFAGTLAGKNPQDAVLWLETIGNADMKRSATHWVLSQWVSRDPAAAGTWARQITAGPERDNAFHVLSLQIGRSDPEAAQAWAADIQDEALRNKTLQNIGQRTGLRVRR